METFSLTLESMDRDVLLIQDAKGRTVGRAVPYYGTYTVTAFGADLGTCQYTGDVIRLVEEYREKTP